jgi:hypothetical protein
MYHQLLTFRNSTFCPHNVFMRSERTTEQTSLLSLINRDEVYTARYESKLQIIIEASLNI